MSIYLIWFFIAVLFLVAEIIVPTFVFFFFGLGSLTVSISTYLISISINTQIILFIISSIIYLLLLRNYLKKTFFGNRKIDEDTYFDKSLNDKNKFATVTKQIEPGSYGEIKYRGTFYKAMSDIVIPIDELVQVESKGNEEESYFNVKKISD